MGYIRKDKKDKAFKLAEMRKEYYEKTNPGYFTSIGKNPFDWMLENYRYFMECYTVKEIDKSIKGYKNHMKWNNL